MFECLQTRTFFMSSRRKKGCSLFRRIHSILPSLKYLFIFLPSWCHFGLRDPWRVKCIKPLTVFTCAGLKLMCEGRSEDGGWDIDHRWMSVRGILTSRTVFHTLSSEANSQRLITMWKYTTTTRYNYNWSRHCFVTHKLFSFMWFLLNNWPFLNL